MKNNLKTIALVAALGLFIVSQVTFAALWNPTTWFNNWSFSSNSDTNTTALEQRIAVLENKLNANASTSTSTDKVVATTTTNSAKPKPLVSSPQTNKTPDLSTLKPVVQQPAQEAYNASTAVFYIYKSEIDFTNTDINQLLAPFSANASSYISDINNLISTAQSYAVSDPADAQFFTLVAQLYGGDENSIMASKNKIDDYIVSLRHYAGALSTAQSQLQGKFISKDDGLFINASIGQNDKQISASIKALTDEYSQITDAFDNDKKYVNSVLQSSIANKQAQLQLLESQRESIQSTYTPPPINFSQTNCSVSSYSGGGSINCATY